MQMVLVHHGDDTISNTVLQIYQEFGKKNDQVRGKTLIWREIEKTGIATFKKRWIKKSMIRL